MRMHFHRIGQLGAALLVLLLVFSSCQETQKRTPPPTDIDYRTPEQKVEPPFVQEGTLQFLTEKDLPITQIAIEIADNEPDRQLGLMFRKSMDEDKGMLFIMENEEPQAFWMKNTYISLDIIFADADFNIVSISERCPTLTEALFKSNAPAKYVIETVAGYCEKHNITVGDRFSYEQDPI